MKRLYQLGCGLSWMMMAVGSAFGQHGVAPQVSITHSNPSIAYQCDEHRSGRSVRSAVEPTTRSESSTSGVEMISEVVPPMPVTPVQYESASEQDVIMSLDVPVGEEQQPQWGPTPPEDIKFIDNLLGGWLEQRGLRMYGWINPGYTFSSTGPGLLIVEPRANRFGNEALVNQMAVVLEKPLDPKEFSLGYNAILFAGADPALIRPRGGFTTTNPRMGIDFRHLYVSAHLPILTEGGVDLKIGRQSTVIGYESALAPYRPFYSIAYQWFYAQDGAWTGALAIWHVNDRLDILNGITLGANTFFTLRASGPAYIGQINYWLQDEKRTMLTLSAHAGDQAIFAAPGLAGNFVTVFEARIFHKWTERLKTVLQTNMGWDANVPGIGTGEFYAFDIIQITHLTKKLDMNFRAEWFNDVQGTRTGFATNYEEITFGFDYHPKRWLRIRPEIRADFANDVDVFDGSKKAQLTLAVDSIISY
ncbi:MAG: hypothetical protein KatS3mg105_0263 [Gemmatales bacterium]|nr:MAG: hypothetical protein KatS3mg105_0263 [Gemmatales bacterium]